VDDVLTILAVADTHFAREPGPDDRAPLPASPLAIEWIRRAVSEARRVASPDVLVILGDLLNDHRSPRSERDRAELAAALRELPLPCVIVPGNHDGDPESAWRAYGQQPGALRARGRLLYAFGDSYAADDSTRRSEEALRAFESAASGQDAVVLQHSPLHPPIDSAEYPWMPLNVEDILAAYDRAGALLSLSGHRHRGAELARRNGVAYLTCAALTQLPFPFYLIRLVGREIAVEKRHLRLDPPGALVDVHVHSHFGYCAKDVNPDAVLARADLLGLGGVACVEHAGQLYLSREDYWAHRHVDDPEAVLRATERGTDRMERFRADLLPRRSERLFAGVEVEVDRNGRLNLLDRDRNGWDVILGAVHWLPATAGERTRDEMAREFMVVTEQLVSQGIHVLAHPLRLFYQKKLPEPEHLYRPLARLLKAHGVAAEINYHINRTPREFFEACLDEGVALAVGSDGHTLSEACDLQPHGDLLRSLNVPPERVFVPIRAASGASDGR